MAASYVAVGVVDFTWTAATTTANTTYDIFYQYGFNAIPDNFAGATNLASVVDLVTFAGLVTGTGGFCTRIRATNPNGFLDRSVTRCHNFIHDTARSDGGGTQIGMNQRWNFTYKLDEDAEMSMKIFAPGTVIYSDTATGFSTTTSVTPIKVIMSSTPRSGELVGSAVSNTDFWDSRYSTGGVVPNGIYYAYLTAETPQNTTRWRGSTFFTVPVDIIRFTAFTTVGITPAQTVANINYTITGDASVRIVIAKRGRTFTLNGSGDVVPNCPAGSTVCQADPTAAGTDISTNSIVQIITFNRKAGTYVETWNGTDQSGVAVSSDIYTCAISAKDGFGNQALSLTGDNSPIATTLPVDRTASQAAGDVTPPIITAMTVNGTSLGASVGANFVPTNPTISGSFTQVIITLDETPGQNTQFSSVTVTGPGGDIFSSTGTADKVITWTSTATQSAAGSYTVKLTVKDTTGNQYTPSPLPGFTIPASGSGGGSGGVTEQTAEQFRNSVSAFPNPARGAPAKIAFTLTVTSTVDLDVYTVLGERVYHETKTFAAGANTFDWSLVNNASGRIGSGIYLVRITAHDGSKSVTAMRKLMVIR